MQVYYHSLTPFRKLFQTGVPVLTYHKVGPRPPGVRLKGLYVSARLFARQMDELQQADFEAPPFGDAVRAPHARAARIALTFDDGFQNVFTHALVPLARNRFYAIQFLVADLLGQSNEWEQHEGEVREPLMDAPQVREWLAAGHEIGSHTLTHPHLTQLPPGQAREEIFASKKKLEDLFGRPIRHFCYPYGDWNEVIRELVQEAGYETACTTGPGVNTAADSSFALKRFTARYPSRNLKAIWSRLSARRR
ncbi:MAG: polysaccharide deacetylase family protein [Verrucomicrobiia bacterium]